MLFLFILTWQVSPGYLKPNKDFDKTIECIAKYAAEPHRICPDCLVLYC